MILFNVDALSSVFVKEPPEIKMGEDSFKKILVDHSRRILLLAFNFLFNHGSFFAAIGWVNKRWNFLSSVFVVYPASEKYALAYVYARHRDKMRWLPWPLGIFRQNGKWGLMMGISSTEREFARSKNIENLRMLENRTEKIRMILGASQKTFAGVLPGILYGRGFINKSIEAEVTVEAVQKAEMEVREAERYPNNIPIILLGGKGFVGCRLKEKMADRDVYIVDNSEQEFIWPGHLNGQKAILVNLTRRGIISEYLDLFWPELILLNEVYPEPGREEVAALTKIGSHAYHISGVVADSYPSFPGAYSGGIPCCAAWNSPDLEIIVRRLN